MTYWPYLLAIVVGAGLTLQVGMNGTIGTIVGSPLLASVVNFVIGTFALCAVALASGARIAPGTAAAVPAWGLVRRPVRCRLRRVGHRAWPATRRRCAACAHPARADGRSRHSSSITSASSAFRSMPRRRHAWSGSCCLSRAWCSSCVADREGDMARTPSTMLPLGTAAPTFHLPDTDGGPSPCPTSPGRALVVIFICNHCPFVKHVRARARAARRATTPRGLAVVAINSQRRRRLPGGRARDDAALDAGEARATFPVPLRRDAGGGAGLPRRLHAGLLPLRPRADARLPRAARRQPSRQRHAGDRRRPARRARRGARRRGRRRADQRPSIGCNIKWKPGNEPDYFAR